MDDRTKETMPTIDKHSRLVVDRSVENEMETSYLQYSMSVIAASYTSWIRVTCVVAASIPRVHR
jgi:hypothetical protein